MAEQKEIKPIAVQADIDIREPIMVGVSQYNGKWRLDIRHYYHPPNHPDDLLPSKKGINIPLDEARHLVAAMAAAFEQATGESITDIGDALPPRFMDPDDPEPDDLLEEGHEDQD